MRQLCAYALGREQVWTEEECKSNLLVNVKLAACFMAIVYIPWVLHSVVHALEFKGIFMRCSSYTMAHFVL